MGHCRLRSGSSPPSTRWISATATSLGHCRPRSGSSPPSRRWISSGARSLCRCRPRSGSSLASKSWISPAVSYCCPPLTSSVICARKEQPSKANVVTRGYRFGPLWYPNKSPTSETVKSSNKQQTGKSGGYAYHGCFYGCFLVIEARGGKLRVLIVVRSRPKRQRQRPDPAKRGRFRVAISDWPPSPPWASEASHAAVPLSMRPRRHAPPCHASPDAQTFS